MEPLRKPPVSVLSAFSDTDLIELISLKDDLPSAMEAFSEFYERYKTDIYKAVHKICLTYTNSYELTGVVFNNTFHNAYTYAHTFHADETDDDITIRKRVFGWLLAIAKNELKAQFDSDRERIAESHELENAASTLDSDQPIQEFYGENLVRKAIEQIPKERDREVFYVYWLYYDETETGNTRKLPSAVITELCEKYSTTDSNLRQIISRSKKIVKEYLVAHFKQR